MMTHPDPSTMTDLEAAAELAKLAEEIAHHNQRYHADDDPEISDADFDALMRRNTALEEAFPHLVLPNSPSKQVGAAPKAGFAKGRHNVPMLSLGNAFNEDDAWDFDSRVRRFLSLDDAAPLAYSVEPKIDGLSINLTYIDGVFTEAVTRGDGAEGEVVTANVRTINDVPKKLNAPFPSRIDIRGEIYMTRSDFLALNESQAASGGKTFANPRNAAAGS
ncbi:MAG: NAD-dependent DNA ligase LigA, partial [Alphaproteobacteria bacterium]|nr:NAD-dependent DNA ligase LigA [Alphaproteobacteria bacterium]